MRAKNKTEKNKTPTQEAGRRESDIIIFRELGKLAQAVIDIKELLCFKFKALEDKIGGLEKKVGETNDDLTNLRDNHFTALTNDVANLRVETNSKLNRQMLVLIISLVLIFVIAIGVAIGRIVDFEKIIGIFKLLPFF